MTTADGEHEATNRQLQEQLNALQSRHNSLQTSFARIQKENDELRARERERQTAISSKGVQRSDAFWQEIVDNFKKNPDYIKALVKNKKLSLSDHDKWDRNLLLQAAWYGSYDISQFCINLGADLEWKDKDGRTALDIARRSGFHHVEQLLLFSQLNVSVGAEVQNTADIMHRQNGIHHNILNELTEIGEQNKELFVKTLMELAIRILNKKLSFSDDLLNLCWRVIEQNGKDPLQSELWKAIKATCSQIIKSGGKTDWYWLKNCLLPSTIWFRNTSNDNEEKPQYLYYELLKLVEGESQEQLNQLQQDFGALAKQHPADWLKLTTWDIPDKYQQVRQDMIPNGIVSRFTYNQLSESSDASFNSPQFYDYNQYLSQLVLLAQIVDDDFHSSVQSMFEIDVVTKVGKIDFSEHMRSTFKDEGKQNDDVEEQKYGDGVIEYARGPVKLIERARYKAQNDYANEPYPASACVLDLNRCALTFNDISTMLAALELFVNKVRYYQSGNIIGIVRDKNGFIEYLKETQYADIKLNVLIKGTHNNIIGEVQFLLKTMKEFKDKAHNLYAIQRQRETIETSISQILPMLLDENKQLFIAANMGDVRAFSRLMVIQNKSVKQVMSTDKESKQNVLHRICTFGHIKALKFIRSILSESAFVDHVFASNKYDYKPIEYAVRYSQVSVVQYLFKMQRVKDRYKDDKNLCFRLLYNLLGDNKNLRIIDFVLSELQIEHRVPEILRYKYPRTAETFAQNAVNYYMRNIIVAIAETNTLRTLQYVVPLMGGEKQFLSRVFDRDGWGEDAIVVAASSGKVDILQYILEMAITHSEAQVVQRVVSQNGMKAAYSEQSNLRSLLIKLNACFDEKICEIIVNGLDITEQRLKEFSADQDLDVAKILKVVAHKK